MTETSKVGWATTDTDGIDLKTVSDTRRAAIVNWLGTKGQRQVYSFHTDDYIEEMWRARRDEVGVIQVRVSIL